MPDSKLAVHICSGCDLGNSLDLDALAAVCEDHVCSVHPQLCSAEGVASIESSAREQEADALVLAACSSRHKRLLPNPNGIPEQRVSLREMVAWSHPANDEDTQMIAEDYLRMGLARATRLSAPPPLDLETKSSILVVGAGIAGISAAIEASSLGHEVILLEKGEKIGGWRNRFQTVFPNRPPYAEPRQSALHEEIELLKQKDLVTLLTDAEIESIQGQPGQFKVVIRSHGGQHEIEVGAIVQATGWTPYDAHRLTHLSYAQSSNIMTNVEFEDLLSFGSIRRPSDGRAPDRIIFIQCAGSRDPDHLPYCSTVCCRVAMKQVIETSEALPDTELVVLYKDIRTPGPSEDLYRKAQDQPKSLFAKCDVESVEVIEGERLRVTFKNSTLGEHLSMDCDLVVLATGMVPRSADGEAIRRYRDARKILETEESKVKLEKARETIEELESSVGESILQLGYRQGPDTPTLRHGFPDSHFICFPYETRRTGIYTAGCVRVPQDSESSRNDGAGAVLKAIQSVRLADSGKSVHPRWEDPTYPEFAMQRCTQCKRCTEECPFGVLNEDAKGTPQPNPARCRRCGICLGACPERVISFSDYSIDIVSSMIKAVEIPDEFEEKPRLLCLACENDAYPAIEIAGLQKLHHSSFIRFIPVRCLGSVNSVWVADALSRGYDGVLLLGCPSGEDYQCHFIRGSELMATRGKNIREKLTQLALEEERVRIEEVSIHEYRRIPEIVQEFEEEIETVGLNPFKGF